jgi:hypothetical protein
VEGSGSEEDYRPQEVYGSQDDTETRGPQVDGAQVHREEEVDRSQVDSAQVHWSQEVDRPEEVDRPQEDRGAQVDGS